MYLYNIQEMDMGVSDQYIHIYIIPIQLVWLVITVLRSFPVSFFEHQPMILMVAVKVHLRKMMEATGAYG